MTPVPIIKVTNLSKTYPNGVQAVRGISLEIAEGEIFGLLGPNGAGKSTILEILETLKTKTAGNVIIGGYDLDTDTLSIKKIIGVQLQFSTFYPRLNVEKLLYLYDGLFQKSVSIENILSEVHLSHKKKSYYNELSGGEKRRLSIAIALLSDPKILYLDEPSTGLDPNVRRKMWQLIKSINKKNVTVLLTTHYMEEAQFLCDKVAIVNKGNLIAVDTPEALIRNLQKEHPDRNLSFTLEDVFVALTARYTYS